MSLLPPVVLRESETLSHLRYTFSTQLARSLTLSLTHTREIVSCRAASSSSSHLVRRAISHGVQGVLRNVESTNTRSALIRTPRRIGFVYSLIYSARPFLCRELACRVLAYVRTYLRTRQDETRQSATGTTAPRTARLTLHVHGRCETARACHRTLTDLPRAIVKKHHARAARVLPTPSRRFAEGGPAPRAQSRFEMGVLMAGTVPGDLVPRDSFLVADLFISKKFFFRIFTN